MKLRQAAISFATAAVLSAPAFAQNVYVVPVPAQDNVVSPNPPTVVVVPPVASPDSSTVVIMDSRPRDILVESGGMTPRERADMAGTQDDVTGVITAPGYHGPRSSKGQ